MLRGVGFTDEDFEKPVVGIASLFSDITPCNALDRLAEKGREGVRAAGGVPQTFGAPTVSDGISMGHRGMRYSLVSREVIADCLETVCGAMNHDGLVAFGGCDKNMPGCVMAMARLNIPSVFVYGGSILPGVGPSGEDVDIVSIFEAVGKFQSGTINASTLHKIECESCPGHGSCGGMYTANTMASAIEAMGLSLPYGASNPAVSAAKEREAYRAGQAVQHCIRDATFVRATSSRVRAWRTPTPSCWRSAAAPNAVLHLMAIAREAGVPWTLDDFDRLGREGPAPGGPEARRAVRDVRPLPRRRNAGRDEGASRERLPARRLHHRSTGRTLAENIAEVPSVLREAAEGGSALRASRCSSTAFIVILKGNLAPEGAVAKVAGLKQRSITGPAKVFDGEEACLRRFKRGKSLRAMWWSFAAKARSVAPGCARC